MPKIGTAVIEVKPVLNEEALATLCKDIEQRIAAAVRRGMQAAINPPQPHIFNGQPGVVSITTSTTTNPTQVKDLRFRLSGEPEQGEGTGA